MFHLDNVSVKIIPFTKNDICELSQRFSSFEGGLGTGNHVSLTMVGSLEVIEGDILTFYQIQMVYRVLPSS